MREIFLDTREFEPPAPMQMVLSELQNMIEGQTYIHQLHRLEPTMLFNRIKPMGIEYIVKKEGDDYHIYYFYPGDKDMVRELCGV